MTPFKFLVKRGDDKTRKLVIKKVIISGDEVVKQLVGDISLYHITMTIRDPKTDVIIYERKNANAGGDDTQISMSNPTNSECLIHFSGDDTKIFKAQSYPTDIEVITDEGERKTIAEGIIEFTNDITRH